MWRWPRMPSQVVPSETARHYERVQSYQRDALGFALAAWSEVSPNAISESWERHLAAVTAAVTSAQVRAAQWALWADGGVRGQAGTCWLRVAVGGAGCFG